MQNPVNSFQKSESPLRIKHSGRPESGSPSRPGGPPPRRPDRRADSLKYWSHLLFFSLKYFRGRPVMTFSLGNPCIYGTGNYPTRAHTHTHRVSFILRIEEKIWWKSLPAAFRLPINAHTRARDVPTLRSLSNRKIGRFYEIILSL